ncbi:MAG: hypothetical protein HQL19_00570 [Candidatus Omnitrophica bacterium]|nr:hypothetical protein [Candidatus Omnitrophota bacterium]
MKKALTCNLCSGEMQLYTGPRFNKKFGSVLFVGGILSTLFWIGPVLGVPLMLIGGYMVSAKRQLWVCRECHTAIERIEVGSETKAAETKKEE